MEIVRYHIENYSFFGLKVSSFSEEDLQQRFIETIRCGDQLSCYGYSLTLLPRFKTMPQIYTIAESCDIMVADGKGFYQLCRWFGVPLRSDWAIYEVTDALLALANREGFSVLLLGSDAASNRRAAENLRRVYPGARILDGQHGYYTPEEEAHVVAQINAANPDILLIGMSSPKKEEFFRNQRAKLKSRVVVLMGGVIDIYSGKTSRIPKVVKRLCLTWLYRIVQEPKRTRQLLWNGLDVIFRLIPAMIWAKWIKQDAEFSIPTFYGVHGVHQTTSRK